MEINITINADPSEIEASLLKHAASIAEHLQAMADEADRDELDENPDNDLELEKDEIDELDGLSPEERLAEITGAVQKVEECSHQPETCEDCTKGLETIKKIAEDFLGENMPKMFEALKFVDSFKKRFGIDPLLALEQGFLTEVSRDVVVLLKERGLFPTKGAALRTRALDYINSLDQGKFEEKHLIFYTQTDKTLHFSCGNDPRRFVVDEDMEVRPAHAHRAAELRPVVRDIQARLLEIQNLLGDRLTVPEDTKRCLNHEPEKLAEIEASEAFLKSLDSYFEDLVDRLGELANAY